MSNIFDFAKDTFVTSHVITDTKGLCDLIDDAQTRNKSVDPSFKNCLDEDGIHVLAIEMLHKDEEFRTMWLTKLIGTDKPTEIWLDVGYDVLNKTKKVITEPLTETSVH